jgi:hypothetical protein
MRQWPLKIGALLFLVGCGGAPFEVGSAFADVDGGDQVRSNDPPQDGGPVLDAGPAPDASGVVDSGDVADASPKEAAASPDAGHIVEASADAPAEAACVSVSPNATSSCGFQFHDLPSQFALNAGGNCESGLTPTECLSCTTYDCACITANFTPCTITSCSVDASGLVEAVCGQ